VSEQRPSFEEIVDACLGDIAAGRRSVEECLARYPDLRPDLEPLLRAAAEMHALPRFEERAPDPARRAALLGEIATAPQQSRRRLRLPGLGLPGLGTLARGVAYAAPAALIVVFALFLMSGRESGTALASSLAVYSGSVERLDGDTWRPLAGDAELSEGDRLRTGEEGRALITFVDGSTAALEPGTEVVLTRVRSDDGARRIELEQLSGELWSDVVIGTADRASYLVRTPEATVRVDGTAFATLVRPGETEVIAAEGDVDVEADGQRVTLAASETIVARRGADNGPLGQRVAAVASTLTIDAPFAASVVSEHGQATGVQPQGEVHQHLPGATTTMPDVRGPQQLSFLAGFPPGEYTLILRRFDDGEGALMIRDASGALTRLPIDRDVTTELRLQVLVTHTDGGVNVEVLAAAARPAPADVVETLPTPQATPTRANDALSPTPSATANFSSAREQLLRRIAAEYLATLSGALQGGDPAAVATALRAATEGDASVARLLVLAEQLKNRTVQLRLVQILGVRTTLPLTLWLDEGEDDLEGLRAAVLIALARYEDRGTADSATPEATAESTTDSPTDGALRDAAR
jgi:hypothetical protein